MAGLPTSIISACLAWFHAANTATSGYALLSMAAEPHPHPRQRRAAHTFRRAAGGRPLHRHDGTFRARCRLESSDLLTRAIPQEDGTHRLFGRKMWISGGDHELADNIVHLVLARTPDAAPGTKGISIFIVPKYLVAEDGSLGERNDIVLAGINHKMGSRGTVNTAPVLGDGAHTPVARRVRSATSSARSARVTDHVLDDERGPPRRRHRRHRRRLHRLPEVPRLCP